jgi:hypothetical protein
LKTLPSVRFSIDVLASTDTQTAKVVEKRCLADSDGAFSHGWALKRLEMYSESEERRLESESDRKLHEMLRIHLQKPALLPPSDAGTPTIPAERRAGIVALFSVVQQHDRLASGLVAGSQTDEQNFATVSPNLWVTHQSIDALLEGLQELNGDPTVK